MAKKNGWVFKLDKDEDSMFYSTPIIPSGSQLFQVTDEFAVYLDKKQKPHGLMLEYFNYNFIKHHKGFEPLMDKIFIKKDEVDPQKSKDKEVKTFKEYFENTVIAEACGADLHQ